MKLNRFLAIVVALCMFAALSLPAFAEDAKPVIGISWSRNDANYEHIIAAIEEAGGTAVMLPQVTSSVVEYDDAKVILPDYVEESGMLKTEYAEAIKATDFSLTNVEEALDGVDAVIFTGGEDISPTLFAVPQTEANHGEDINATRDISDYVLMNYCQQNDIVTLGFCRGMQMLSIVAGCEFTQDIPDYYAAKGLTYADTHRMPPDAPDRTYARHDITLTDKDSILYSIVGADTLANVSSWHHQGVVGVDGTALKVTAVASYDGVDFIEAVERTDKTFCVGLQFHPENDCRIVLLQNETSPCDYDTCINFFKVLVAYAAGAEEADAAA